MSKFLNANEMSCAILRHTRDGNNLDPVDLKLVEMAVNGNINELGEAALMNLYERCTSAEGYKKAWLHGVENLTIDHVGYVYWKGRQIEHWTVEASPKEKWEAEAKELQYRCLKLEEAGIPVNTYSVIWAWPDILDSELVKLRSRAIESNRFYQNKEIVFHGGGAAGTFAVTSLCQMMQEPEGRTLDITNEIKKLGLEIPAPYTRAVEITSMSQCFPQQYIKLLTEELFWLVEKNVETV